MTTHKFDSVMTSNFSPKMPNLKTIKKSAFILTKFSLLFIDYRVRNFSFFFLYMARVGASSDQGQCFGSKLVSGVGSGSRVRVNPVVRNFPLNFIKFIHSLNSSASIFLSQMHLHTFSNVLGVFGLLLPPRF